MGLVVSMAMLALALVLGSFLSLDLRSAGVAAGICAAITALISAFVAGFFAVKASAPDKPHHNKPTIHSAINGIIQNDVG